MPSVPNEVERFLDKQKIFIDKYIPEGLHFTVIFTENDGTTHHMSSLSLRSEAVLLRELARQIHKNLAEMN